MSRSLAVGLQMLVTVWLSLSLVACSSTAPTAVPSGSAGPPTTEPTIAPSNDAQVELGGDWVLRSAAVAGQEIPFVNLYYITLEMRPDVLGGTSACNFYGMPVRFAGHNVTKEEGPSSTAMSCGEEADRIDELYLSALAEIQAVETITEVELVLVGPQVRLVYGRDTGLPLPRIFGTTWTLTGLRTGQGPATMVAQGDPAELALSEPDALVFTSPCTTYEGNFAVDDDDILHVRDLDSDGTCPAELTEQDELVVAVLGGQFRLMLNGDTLIVGDHPMTPALIYEAK